MALLFDRSRQRQQTLAYRYYIGKIPQMFATTMSHKMCVVIYKIALKYIVVQIDKDVCEPKSGYGMVVFDIFTQKIVRTRRSINKIR